MILSEAQKEAALEALAEENGDIDCDRVWKAARSENHPLHDYFSWDVNEAAVEHWRHTARGIIASCRIEVTYKQVTFEVPKYVRDPDKPYNEQGYALTESIASEEDRARAALETELARAESAIRRAANLARAFDLVDEFDDMLKRIAVLRRQIRSEQKEEALAK